MSQQPAACGTKGGYDRHRRNDEEPDEACRQAHNQAVNAHRNKKGYNRARSRALNRLSRLHPEDFQRLYTDELATEAFREQAGA